MTRLAASGHNPRMANGSTQLDAILIGGGHNGLVCATYLAKAGLKVLVLERRGVVGGAAVTEEFHPGFRNSVAAYTVSLLQPKVIRDLDLAAHGLNIVLRKANNFLPLPDGRYLLTGAGRTQGRSREVLAHAMPSGCPSTSAGSIAIADVLRALALEAPPNVTDGRLAEGSAGTAARGAARQAPARNSTPTLRTDLLDLFAISAAEYLDRFFESEPIKAVLGFDGIVGNYASPYTPGSAYVLLHHVFGEVNGVKGAWGHAIGGMGAITQAMAKAAAAAGVEIRTGAGVREVIVEERTRGRRHHRQGRTSCARARSSPTSIRNCCTNACSIRPSCRAPTRERMANWRCGSGTFRMNVALSAVAAFHACCPSRAIISRPASSWRRVSTTWIAPISMRARRAGRRSPSSRC